MATPFTMSNAEEPAGMGTMCCGERKRERKRHSERETEGESERKTETETETPRKRIK